MFIMFIETREGDIKNEKITTIGLLAALVVIFSGLLHTNHVAADASYDNISKQGTQLYLHGKPYKFEGINAYTIATDYGVNYGCGEYFDDAELNTLFTSLGPNNVVRFWAWEQFGTNKYTGQRDWSAIDRVMNAAAAHEDRVIFVLGNDASSHDCDSGPKDINWYTGGFNQPLGSDPDSYDTYVHDAVMHYKNSPALGMWEPLNEAQIACQSNGAGNAGALKYFFDTIGGEIHTLDPNHLISEGVAGESECSVSGGNYSYLLASNGIDVATYHDYSETDTFTEESSVHMSEATAANKPLIVEESGVSGASPCRELVDRNTIYQNKITAMFAGGISGYMPWWASTGGTANCNTNVGFGDPYYASVLAYQLAHDADPINIIVNATQTYSLETVADSVDVQSGGTLKGDGSTTSLTVEAGAILAPGHSPGCITTGSATLDGTYQVDFGGTTACIQYDQLIVSGAVSIGGSLQITPYNSYVPTVGQSITIIHAATTSGSFVGLPEASSFTQNGVTYTITYVGNSGHNDTVLTVTNVDQPVAVAAAVAAAAKQTPPQAPNTGLALLRQNPFAILTITIIATGFIIVVKRRQQRI